MNKIITKTVCVEGLKVERKKDVKRLHEILLKYSKGTWWLLREENPNRMICVLEPTIAEIEAAGYDWKEYRNWEWECYKDRCIASTWVGAKYLG